MPYLIAPEAMGELLAGEPPCRSDQLRHWLYRTPVLSADDMTHLPGRVRDRIGRTLWPFTIDVEQTADAGTTRKWLFRGKGGASIETVLMGYPSRTTLCSSSQAGCALACTFCATGQFGFERHLSPGEMAAQVAYANASLRASPIADVPARVTKVVFMGMGEPLANYGGVHEALWRMIEVMGMSPRSITVSTVGLVPGIHRLAHSPWKINLAVSLHAADDELRSELVPLNDRYDIASIVEAATRYFEVKGRRISIEWALISDKNDTADQARKLAAIAKNLTAHVNVIALNPTPRSPERPPDEGTVQSSMRALREAGANATLRDTRGRDIDAACEQLRIRSVTVPG